MDTSFVLAFVPVVNSLPYIDFVHIILVEHPVFRSPLWGDLLFFIFCIVFGLHKGRECQTTRTRSSVMQALCGNSVTVWTFLYIIINLRKIVFFNTSENAVWTRVKVHKVGMFSCTLPDQKRERERQKILLQKSHDLSIREVYIPHVRHVRADVILYVKPKVVTSWRVILNRHNFLTFTFTFLLVTCS